MAGLWNSDYVFASDILHLINTPIKLLQSGSTLLFLSSFLSPKKNLDPFNCVLSIAQSVFMS